MIDFNETKKLLQQLPVAYYLKRKLDVTLDYADTSYIDIYNNKLVVSYNQLTQIENPTQKDIRCLLYHEVSHAFLTPLELSMSDIVNIFEDERIETICKDFYLDTNFKDFVKKVNNYNGELPTSARQFFYQIVRYEVGPSQFVAKTKEIIKKYAKLNRDSCWSDCSDYSDDIYCLYQEVEDYWNNNQASIQEQSTENQKVDQEASASSQEENNIDSQASTEKVEESSNVLDKDFEKAMNDSLKEGLDNLQKQFDDMIDNNIQETFRQILLKKTSSAKTNGSAINAYSGIFDPRSVVRQDYKYFIQKNRAGNVKRFSKIKMNLFIDNSGSFGSSQNIVNKLLYNLAILERQTSDFEFDVVTMSSGEHLLSKDKRQIYCCGCNYLSNSICRLFNEMQDKTSQNVNIVLFDGSAVSGYDKSSKKKYAENFKAFNHQNCIIISDTANEEYVNKYCQAAKKIIVDGNYANLLIKNVVNNLQYGLR